MGSPDSRPPSAGDRDLSGRGLAAARLAWAGNRDVSQDPAGAVQLVRALSFRNFAGLPFVVSASPNACSLAADKALRFIAKSADTAVWRLSECPPRLIRMLREREILPQRAVSFPGKKEFKYLAAASDGAQWTLVNEVEHITRGQVFSGFPSADAFASRFVPPEEDQSDPPWARSRRFGYLASDPAHAGPGMGWEAIVHLPGLALARQLPQARNYLATAGVECQPIPASLFRLRFQGGLGRSPRAFYESFLHALRPVLRHEHAARRACLEKHHKRLEERVHQSFQRLAGATSLAYGDMLETGSLVRMGAGLGMLNPEIAGILEELRVTAGAGHLAVTSGRDLPQEEEDFSRANVVRLSLMDHSGEAT